MGRVKALLGAIGAGAALLSLFVGATLIFRADALGSWLLKEDPGARARRSWLAADRKARLAANYVDSLREAGF